MKLKTTSQVNLSYCFKTENCIWLQYPEILSPITISVCHDGLPKNDFLGLAQLRQKGSILSDMKVWSLVKGLSWGYPLNLVRGLVPRAFIDYNRDFSNTEIPFSSNLLQASYYHFHNQILFFVEQSKEIYTKNLFIDMHGFAKQPTYGEYDLIFGTGNRTTVKGSVDQDIALLLQNAGYSVFLPKEETYIKNQKDYFNGGFTVRNVFEKTSVDSIQIEVHSSIRKDYQKSVKFSRVFRSILKEVM